MARCASFLVPGFLKKNGTKDLTLICFKGTTELEAHQSFQRNGRLFDL